MFQKLDYSTDASEKTIEQLKNLLRFDPARTVYSKKHAQEFVKVWEEKFSETALLQFRKLLCHEFPQEISLYTPLFFGVHKIVSIHLDIRACKNRIITRNRGECTQQLYALPPALLNHKRKISFHL